MSMKKESKTPMKALTLAKLLEPSTCIAGPSGLQSVSKHFPAPKRLADLLGDIGEQNKKCKPKPTQSSCSAMKINSSAKITSHIKKYHLSTSKKLVRFRKSDDNFAKRALNFYTSQDEDSKIFQKIPQSIRKTIQNDLTVYQRPNTRISTREKSLANIQEKRKSIKPDDQPTTYKSQENGLFGMRMSLKFGNEGANSTRVKSFTQYRNIDDSFNASLVDDTPQKNIVLEKSIVEKEVTNEPYPDLSDSLCEMMGKTILSSSHSDISKILKEINQRAQQNIENSKRILVLTKEIEKSLPDLIEKNNTKKKKNNIKKSTPKGIKHVTLKSVNNSLSESKQSSTQKASISTIPKRIVQEVQVGSSDLRKAVLLTATDKKIDNIENISPVENKKSFQIYTTLKNNVNFLKTPLGKSKTLHNRGVDTPNTRSRNITSNNVQRQLQLLYD